MWTITLNDGTKYEGLTANGNNFFAPYELTAEMFPSTKLQGVKIEYDGDDLPEDSIGLIGEYEHLRVQTIGKAFWMENTWRVIFVPVQVTETDRLRGDITYIAMMSGVEL